MLRLMQIMPKTWELILQTLLLVTILTFLARCNTVKDLREVTRIDALRVNGLEIVGQYAYLSDGYDGLKILDVSDPVKPTLLGTYETPGFVFDLAVADNYAYLAKKAKEGGGLYIVDISDPTTPFEAGRFTEQRGFAVAVSDGYAYFLTPDAGMLVLDVSEPALPVVVGQYQVAGSIHQVMIVDDYAYVSITKDSSGSTDLQILDISDPTRPRRRGSYEIFALGNDVEIRQGYAYIANSGRLLIVDVSDPARPAEVGWHKTSSYAQNIVVDGPYAYIADNSSVQVFDISNPQKPRKIAVQNTRARDVALVDGYLYVVSVIDGLSIFEALP